MAASLIDQIAVERVGVVGRVSVEEIHDAAQTFERVSKNLKAYPSTLAYTSGLLSSITYDLGGGQSITKTLGYTGEQLTSVVLSGDTPSGINLTKTLGYTGDDLTSVSYS